MSWAKLLKDNKEKLDETQTPVTRVYAPDPTLTDAEQKLRNACHETVKVKLPEYQKGLMVLDANALIKGMDNLNSTADAFVTTAQVVTEIRDKASRELMERLPHALTILDPSPEAVKEIVAVAERTGDLGVLSRTDIRLCALALDCCRAAGCMGSPIEPRAAQVNPNSQDITTHDEEVTDDEADEGEEEEGGEQDAEEPEGDNTARASGGAMPGWGTGETNSKSGSDEDDGEWITPDNIHNMQNGQRVPGGTERFDGGCACVTSDFAMQNTLLHLGVPLVGTNGMRIKELRSWLLRCTACFTLVMDSTRQFCPACGSGDTLRRVSYVVNAKGEKQLFINFKRHISTRGTVYNLPRPRGGKKGTNRTLVLREDQLYHVLRGKSSASVKAKQALVMDPDDDDLAMFGEAPQHKKRDLAQPRMTSSYHKYNVNEKKKARAAHRK